MIRMPERGKIYDDNGSIIASNKIHYSLKMTPGQIDDLNSVIVKLNSYIDLETEEVELIKNVYRTYRAYTSHIIKRNLDWNEVAKISTNLLNLSGVEIDTESIRHYPKSSKYFHIAGYTSSASKEELRRDNFYSYPGIKLGKSGVELTFEKFLIGFPGNEEVEVVQVIRDCNRLDIQTVWLTSDDDLPSNGVPTLLTPVPDLDAIVSTGCFRGSDIGIPEVPSVERVIGSKTKQIGRLRDTVVDTSGPLPPPAMYDDHYGLMSQTGREY